MIQDLRFAVRMLAKNKSLTMMAVLTLALGIGANTAIFSIVHAVLLRPLPYPDADRLMLVRETHPQFGAPGFLSPDFKALLEQNRVLELPAAHSEREFTLTGHGQPEELEGRLITSNFMPLLGVQPLSGRVFATEEFQAGHDKVLLVSHSLWQRRFGANPHLIGQSLTLDDRSYTVVGILPPEFRFAPAADLWLPLTFDAEALSDRGTFELEVLARLNPSVTVQQAQNELSAITRGLGPPYSWMKQGMSVRLDALQERLVKDVRQKLLVFWGAVGFVLLISCANVANLLLARGAGRHKEFAIRAALGARRLRIVRQLLTESVLLALLGGAAGLFLAHWGTKLLVAASPDNIPRLVEAGVDTQVVAFSFLVSFVTGVLFGLAPALQFSKPDLNRALKDGATASLAGFRLLRHHRMRSLLVVAEIALSLVLLAGAGLLIRSFWLLEEVKLGYDPERLLTLQLALPMAKYRNPQLPSAHTRSGFGWLWERSREMF